MLTFREMIEETSGHRSAFPSFLRHLFLPFDCGMWTLEGNKRHGCRRHCSYCAKTKKKKKSVGEFYALHSGDGAQIERERVLFGRLQSRANLVLPGSIRLNLSLCGQVESKRSPC